MDVTSDDIAIVPLTPDRFDLVAALFGQGGDPRWCWCQYWRKPNANWSNTRPDENREDLRSLANHEPAPGLLAIRDGRAIGWVGLAPRDDLARLARSRTIPRLDWEAVWVVNCFVVAKEARRQGIAARLLDAAVAYAGANGARVVEGYPAETNGERMPSASAYLGTTDLFRRAGFAQVAETSSRAAGGLRRVVVRRSV